MALGSYIFDANTETPDTVARRRQIADALLRQAMGGDSQPKSVMAAIGQGLGNLGEVLAYRRINNRADQAEKAGQSSVGDLSGLFGGDDGDASANATPATSGAPVDTTSSGDMAPYQKALLDTIAGTESPGYNVMYGGGRFSDYSHHPNQAIPIKSGPNAGRTSSAAGRYQFLGSTWNTMAQKLGLTDFSPASQDKAAWALASETYRAKTGGDLDAALQSGDPHVLAGVGRALSGTWTSLPGGIEQGQGANRFVQSFNRYLGGAGQQPTQVASLDPSAGMNAGMGGDAAPPASIGGFTQPSPVAKVASALQQAQGGGPAPANPAVQRVAQAMSQRARTALGILQNPWASDGQKAVASAVLKQEMEQNDPAHQLAMRKAQLELQQLEHPAPKYGFTSVGDNLIRTDDAGNAIPVYQGQPKPPTPPSDVLEYQYYTDQEKAAGRQPLPFGDWQLRGKKAGATSVNVGQSEYGTIPPGYALRKDPVTGELTEYKIKGGPADSEDQAAADKAAATDKQAAMYAGIVTDDIDRAIDGIDKANIPATGLSGWITQSIPGTPGYDIARLIQTVKANAGFDRLQQMRAASPTGGALGNVSNFEGELLQSTVGSLDQAQSKDQLIYNLKRVKEVYTAILTKGIKPDDPLAKEIMGDKAGGDQPPPGVDPEAWKYMTPEERSLWK